MTKSQHTDRATPEHTTHTAHMRFVIDSRNSARFANARERARARASSFKIYLCMMQILFNDVVDGQPRVREINVCARAWLACASRQSASKPAEPAANQCIQCTIYIYHIYATCTVYDARGSQYMLFAPFLLPGCVLHIIAKCVCGVCLSCCYFPNLSPVDGRRDICHSLECVCVHKNLYHIILYFTYVT